MNGSLYVATIHTRIILSVIIVVNTFSNNLTNIESMSDKNSWLHPFTSDHPWFWPTPTSISIPKEACKTTINKATICISLILTALQVCSWYQGYKWIQGVGLYISTWHSVVVMMLHLIWWQHCLCFWYLFITHAKYNEWSLLTSACIYIINGCHLPLGSDWLHAVEYGGYTRQKSGKYSYCLLHPPPSDTPKTA